MLAFKASKKASKLYKMLISKDKKGLGEEERIDQLKMRTIKRSAFDPSFHYHLTKILAIEAISQK